MSEQSERNEETETWFTADGEEDGRPLIFRSRVNAAVNEADYPYLMTVYWYFDNDENGVPDVFTNDLQIAFEDALENIVSGEFGYLMLVVTGNGRKEWHWYVADIENWMDEFNELLAGHPDYPLEIENSHEPGWDLYHKFIAGVEGLEDVDREGYWLSDEDSEDK